MSVPPDFGLALLQGGAVLTASVVIREYCARHLAAEMVPRVLSSRIQLCNRIAPMMLLLAVAMVLTGALVRLAST